MIGDPLPKALSGLRLPAVCSTFIYHLHAGSGHRPVQSWRDRLLSGIERPTKRRRAEYARNLARADH